MTVTALMSAHTSERQRTRPEGRRDPTQQTELFGNERPGARVGTPAWHDLPAATQIALTSLIARLIVEHAEARRAGPEAQVSHDL